MTTGYFLSHYFLHTRASSKIVHRGLSFCFFLKGQRLCLQQFLVLLFWTTSIHQIKSIRKFEVIPNFLQRDKTGRLAGHMEEYYVPLRCTDVTLKTTKLGS